MCNVSVPSLNNRFCLCKDARHSPLAAVGSCWVLLCCCYNRHTRCFNVIRELRYINQALLVEPLFDGSHFLTFVRKSLVTLVNFTDIYCHLSLPLQPEEKSVRLEQEYFKREAKRSKRPKKHYVFPPDKPAGETNNSECPLHNVPPASVSSQLISVIDCTSEKPN